MSFAATVPVNDIVATRPESWRMYHTDYPSRDEIPEEVLLLRTPFAKYWSRNSIGPSFSYTRTHSEEDENMRNVWAAAYVRYSEILDNVALTHDDLEKCLTEAARRAGITAAKLIWNLDPDLEREVSRAVLTESGYRKFWLPKVIPLADHIDLPLLRERYANPSSVFKEHSPKVFSRHIIASEDSNRVFSAEQCQILESENIPMGTAMAYQGLPFPAILDSIKHGVPVEYALSGADL